MTEFCKTDNIATVSTIASSMNVRTYENSPQDGWNSSSDWSGSTPSGLHGEVRSHYRSGPRNTGTTALCWRGRSLPRWLSPAAGHTWPCRLSIGTSQIGSLFSCDVLKASTIWLSSLAQPVLIPGSPPLLVRCMWWGEWRYVLWAQLEVGGSIGGGEWAIEVTINTTQYNNMLGQHQQQQQHVRTTVTTC